MEADSYVRAEEVSIIRETYTLPQMALHRSLTDLFLLSNP